MSETTGVNESTVENCITLARLVNISEFEQAKEFCRGGDDFGNPADVGDERYEEIKRRAQNAPMRERHEYWGSLLEPASEDYNEFVFVVSNYLFSVGRLFEGVPLDDQPEVFTAAATLFDECGLEVYERKARARRLSSRGHIAKSRGDIEVAAEFYTSSLAQLEHPRITPLHFYGHVLRDVVLSHTRLLEEKNEIADAIEFAETMREKFDDVESNSVDNFRAQVNARLHELRAMKAEMEGDVDEQIENLRTSIELFNEGQKDWLAQKKEEEIKEIRKETA